MLFLIYMILHLKLKQNLITLRLTIADKKSHNIIEKGFKNIFPEIPILSEEGKIFIILKEKIGKLFGLLIHLDGTKEFIKRNGEFTVNIALIKDNYPIFGSVYAPYKKELYWAYEGLGAWKSENKASKFQIFKKIKNDKKKNSNKSFSSK